MIQTGAIVLSHLKYGDHSVIATLYTEAMGRQSILLKGAFGKKTPMKASFFRPLYILDITLHHRPRRSLQYIDDVSTGVPFLSIPYDPVKSSIALFMAEVLYKTLREEEPNMALYSFLTQVIQVLDLSRSGTANFHLLFLLHLSRFLGFYPPVDFVKTMPMGGVLTPESVDKYNELMNLLMHTNFEQLHEVELNHVTRNGLLEILLSYYAWHMEGFNALKSVPVLKTLFS